MQEHSLHQLEHHGLISRLDRALELQYEFRHALVRDAAYGSLLKRQRRELHRAAGEVLEAEYGGQAVTGEVASQLGYHFAEAGDDGRALRYFTLAAQAAEQSYANAEAALHYGQALEIALRSQAGAGLLETLYLRRGRLLELSQQYVAALQHYAAMEHTGQQLDNQRLQLESWVRRLTIHATPNPAFNPEEAHTIANRLLPQVRALGEREAEAKVLWSLLLLSLYTGQPEQARHNGEAALQLARELNLRELLAYILNDLYLAYASAGHSHRMAQVIAEARALWQELGNLPMLTENFTRAAVHYSSQGDFSRATAEFEEAYRLALACRNPESQVVSLAFAGRPHLELGHIDQGLALMQQALTLGEVTGNMVVLAGTRAELALVYGQLGALQPALALARQAEQIARQRFPLILPWPQAVVVQLHLLNNDVVAARAAAAGLGHYRVHKQRLSFLPSMWVHVALAAAQLALAEQARGQAVVVLDELLEDLDQGHLGSYRPEALRLKAQALLEGSPAQLEAAWQLLHQARAEAEAMGARRSLWVILDDLARLEDQLGNSQAAAAWRQQERELIGSLSTHTGAPELRRAFLALPAVHAVLHST